RTRDLAQEGDKVISTSEMGEAIITELDLMV
ncbi:hypothetical protein MNBD_ALPHA08-1084, partial [hydrothermal vent metagenome]